MYFESACLKWHRKYNVEIKQNYNLIVKYLKFVTRCIVLLNLIC